MKNKYIKIILMVLSAMMIVVACDDKTSGTAKNGGNSRFNFETKLAYEEGEDGWIHYFVYDYPKEDEGGAYYGYDAYNLKYKTIEGYEIEIYDEEGNVEAKAYSTVPSLTLRNDCAEDFELLFEFFENNAPTEPLTDEQQQKLQLEVLDKKLVVELYNKAIQSEKLEEGKYYYFPEADMVQGEMMNGYMWQVGFLIQHGLIIKVNIELIYEDETYLTDIVSAGKGSDEQNSIAEMIENIERSIEEHQSYIVDKEMYIDSENIACDSLDKLLREIEDSYKFKGN